MLRDRVVILTHALHFVGPRTGGVLAGHGATVVCHDAAFADPAARDRFAAENPTLSAARATEPEDLVAEVMAAHGRVDVLVSNDTYPAVRRPVDETPAGEAPGDEMRRALESLVVWPHRLIGAAVPHMKARGAGKVLMVTSAAPLRGLANYSMYAAARGAGNALVKSLSLELAAANIQVNAIAPNYIENPTYFPPALLADEAAMAKMLRNIPAKRLGKPEEVAELIAFFASDLCGFVTGHVVPVSGGWA
ncbi:MAG: SDR family oxidoreductase [Hyphomicrobiales bacterium]|nr:SDR family oxidoreductase [Hyphomicrobiales bacterium]MCP5372017.1 SDR family oxidoreductase [Hyphomicrobiales bacterium]